MAIGLDFTSSDKEYTLKGSRHYICNEKKNQYEEVVSSYLDTFSGLTQTKQVRLYGFGAKLDFLNLKSISTSFFSYSQVTPKLVKMKLFL
jgi:Copine